MHGMPCKIYFFVQNNKLLIKNKIDISGKQSHNALVNHLGMIAEIILHSLRTVERVDRHGVLHDDLILLLDDANNVVSAVLGLLHPCRNLDISLFEVKVTKRFPCR